MLVCPAFSFQVLDGYVKWLTEISGNGTGVAVTSVVVEAPEQSAGCESSDRNKSAQPPGPPGPPSLQVILNSTIQKKEIMVTARLIQCMAEEKEKEKTLISNWEGNLQDLLSNLATSGPEKDSSLGLGEAAAGTLQSEIGSQDVTPIVSQLAFSARQWDAQCAAAFVTAVLMGNYGYNKQLLKLTAGESELDAVSAGVFLSSSKVRSGDHDIKLSDRLNCVVIRKKKLGVQIEVPGGEMHDSKAEAELNAVRMHFCGRVVVVPEGQPATFLKLKIEMKSSFFRNLGFKAYITPIVTPPSLDVAHKNPLFVPAWSVGLQRSEKKAPNMVFDAVSCVIAYSDKEIDVKLPCLKLAGPVVNDPDNLSAVKVKEPKEDNNDSDDKDQHENQNQKYVFSLDSLTRPFTADESADTVAREEIKSAKVEAKKRKAEALQFQFEGFDTEGNVINDSAAMDDEQLDLDSGVLKHILRWSLSLSLGLVAAWSRVVEINPWFHDLKFIIIINK